MYQRSYEDVPGLLGVVFELLDVVFPGISAGAAAAGPLGLDWSRASVPFVKFKGETAIAHVGVLTLPLVLQDTPMTVAAIHAVCTHPARRHQGHYRDVMTEAMRWVDERYETAVLLCDHPALYTPFGFRVVPESRFVLGAPVQEAPTQRGTLRKLGLSDVQDSSLWRRIAEGRAPVSATLGVSYEPHVFAFNAIGLPMHYAAELDAVVSFAIKDSTLHVFDVIARSLPAWPELSAHLPITDDISSIRFHFTPDGLGLKLDAPPHPDARDGFLMVKGPFLPEQLPKCFPRTGEC